MARRFRCSTAASDRGEALHATASQVRRWVLVEQPGGWGDDAVLQSRLAADVALALRARARAVGARVLLIRRHGRYSPAPRTCLVAVTTSRVQRVERLVVEHPAELLDVDWAPLARYEPIGGEPVSDPVYLVCTNGRHDPCCSEFGRPLAEALTAALPEQVWESSHFGGDRFAGNLVCLPDGIYYGRVAPADASRLVREHAAGRIDVDHYRGRSFLSFPMQAAEQFVRTRLGMVGVHDVQPTAARHLGDDVVRVELLVAGEPVVTEIAVEHPDEPVFATCRAARPLRPPRYRLLTLQRLV